MLDRHEPVVPMVHMRQQHHPGTRRNRPGIGRNDRLVIIKDAELAGDRLNALALLALEPAGARGGIIPGRYQYLVSRLKRYAENCRRQTFRGIAIERDFGG